MHHVRAVHGSAPNAFDRDRRLLLFQFRAADAWPLLGFPGDRGVRRADGSRPPTSAAARRVPVRLPLPPAAHQGSIYENQKGFRGAISRTPQLPSEPRPLLQPGRPGLCSRRLHGRENGSCALP